MEEKLNPTQQKHKFTNEKKCTVLKHKINTKKLKQGLVAFYNIWPRNTAGLFSTEKKGGKVRKEISVEAHDTNKQTIYIAPKLKIESMAHYVPEPAWGPCTEVSKTLLVCCRHKTRMVTKKNL